MPSPSSRRLMVSRASITLIEKCLPTSRRKSTVDSGPVQSMLLTMIAPVADESGGAAGQHDRAMAGALETLEREQRHQVSGVQAGGGGIETGIEGEPTGGQRRAQGIQVGGLCDQSTPGQFIDDVAAQF